MDLIAEREQELKKLMSKLLKLLREHDLSPIDDWGRYRHEERSLERAFIRAQDAYIEIDDQFQWRAAECCAHGLFLA